MLIVSEAQV